MFALPPSPLLDYTFTLDHPPRVRQRLCVYDDGEVWYWATLPGGDRVDGGAGTYTFPLQSSELASVRELATSLVETAAPRTPAALPVWGMIEAQITARVGDAEQTHAYEFVAEADRPPALRQAADLAPDLIVRAEAAPLAVIRLAVEVSQPLPDRSQRAILTFAFTNAGTQPVTFTVAPDTLRAQRHAADSWTNVWRLGGEPLLGLVSPAGEPLDGLLVPATLDPGATARLVFPDAVDMPTGGATAGGLRGIAGGTIILRQPDGQAAAPAASYQVISV